MSKWSPLSLFKRIRFEDFIISPFIISLILALLIILFMPRFQKYKLKIIEQYKVDKAGGHIFYSDLDQDGYSEKIVSFEDMLGRSAIRVTTHDDKTVDQWAFEGKLPPRKHNLSVFAGDFNQDRLEELFSLYRSNDSVFLDIITPMDSRNFEKKKIFIDLIGKLAEKADYSVHFERLKDMNGDGSKDLLFNIYAGFSLQPRRLYLYDIVNDKLFKSPEAGVVLQNIKILDLDGDGYPEIAGNTSGPGNIKVADSIPYRDSSSYLMVMDHELEFEFDPIEFPVYKSAVITQPLVQGDSTCLLVLSRNSGIQEMANSLRLYNSKGEFLIEKTLYNSEIQAPGLIDFENKDRYENVLMFDEENLATFDIDASLELKQINNVPEPLYYHIQDLDEDGKMEYIGFANRNNSLIVTDENFKHTANIKLENDGSYQSFISFVQEGKGIDKIFVQRGSSCFIIAYYKNPWYKYLLFIHAGIWMLIYLFLILLKKIYSNQILKQQALAKEISALQLNSINNQINPHFIFNAMNSITSAIYKEDKEKAYRFGTKFSNLMREALLSSDQISRSLEKELEFVKNYLDLEKLRFKGKFDYRIEKDEDIKMQVEIPKMIIQTFVENSVKHGLVPLKENGLIVIRIRKQNNMLQIEIEDNGIGRKEAAGIISGSTGKGLGIVKQIFDLYKRLKGVEIHYSIIDRKNNSGNTQGTLVKLIFPYLD